jgi:HlyD family secretion protein
MYAIQNDLNNGQSRLAELQLTRVTSENQRRRARVQRRLEIKRQETRLRLDREKLDRTSRIVAHVEGTVTQILTAPDELVREGAPVVLLSSPKTDPGTDDPGEPYESLVFVPAGEGKKIDVRDRVEVMPATVKREEYGYIHGTVVSVSELPATRLAMEAALQHPDLVDTFLKRYAPGVLLRVYVHLESRRPSTDGGAEDPGEAKGNPFRWSSRSGARRPLKTGTMCEAAIVVEQQPLIALVIPWIKGRLDLD